MAKTAERSGEGGPSTRDVGRNLRQVRKQQGLSRSAVARSAGLTRRELAAYERGRVDVPESDLWCLAGSCGVDVGELLPRREPLQIRSDLSAIGVGDTVRRLRNPGEPEGLLREYLAMIYELRNLPPGSRIPLRQPDLVALADALGGTPESIEHRLAELIGASPEEAARLRAMILPPRSLPSGEPTMLPPDPYASLGSGEFPAAVEEFFARPGPADPFAPPAPAAAAMPPPAPMTAPDPSVVMPPPAPTPDPTAVVAAMPPPAPGAPLPPPVPEMPSAPVAPVVEMPPPDLGSLPPPAAEALTHLPAPSPSAMPVMPPPGYEASATGTSDLFTSLAEPPAAPAPDPFSASGPPYPPPPGAVDPLAPPAGPIAFPAPPMDGRGPAPAPLPADPFAVPGTTPDPLAAASLDALAPPSSASDPFAGPVNPSAAAAADPFAPAPADDPLAPAPLPPDPFGVPAPPAAATDIIDVGSTETPAAPAVDAFDAPVPPPPNGNGGGIVVDDPFSTAPPAPTNGNGSGIAVDDPFTAAAPAAAPIDPNPDQLGINVLDAIVVDDPLGAPARSDVDVLTPGAPEPVDEPVSAIAWSATPTAPDEPATLTSAPATATPPRFEKASARWQIGGIFPATAMADDGTLALRRADARWALTDLRAGDDCIIEAAVDFRAGSGFGIIFRGSVHDGERITGYSFDVDPIAGGGGYLVRLWEDSRQHWRPIAQAPVTDPAHLYGRHVLRLSVRADQLTVAVDDDPVLEVAALSRAAVELGREPCRGDRVGIQAWSTTEVTIDSFRVATL